LFRRSAQARENRAPPDARRRAPAEIDVKAIRNKSGLSRQSFADS